MLAYYLRKYKLQLFANIWPVEVELPLLMVNKESLFRVEDYKYVAWCGLAVLMIGFISLYEKVRNARTMQ